ncbi:hypothetical protein HC341_11935 [Aquisalimonas sp. 2447]|uniref:hypothetical protein n=1 Tax=Aquisalimonas sp. 2447 TaxID=2740807 RepID=UPI0014327A22|nr:hypothetical protein [Aquisalimonas sp. 2447]QIT55858.1 hypothetical protein HC341_11935 [Aquisalimonas sp. 2447]
MAERQTLENLYEAIFGVTPSTARLDESEEELADRDGDLFTLTSDWATRDNSIHSRVRDSIREDLSIDEDPSAEQLDEGVFFGRLVENHYQQLLGRAPGDEITNVIGSDSEILELEPDDLTAAQQGYFSEGVDFEGFQFWVRELMEGAVPEGELALNMMEGARRFESDDAELVQLNQLGLGWLDPAEAPDPMELDLPTERALELDWGTHTPENSEESGVHITPQEDDTLVHVVNRVLGEEEWTVNGSQADNVSASISQNFDNAIDVAPKLSEVDTLFIRNTPTVDLRDADDLGNLVFRDTDAPGAFLVAENIDSATDLGISNVNANAIVLDDMDVTSVHNTAIRGYEGAVVLDGVSGAPTSTQLNIDSLQSDGDLDNDIYLVADSANSLRLSGDEDLTLVADDGMALTRVDARQLDAELDVDVSDPGLAEASTQFNAVVYGSNEDTTVRAGDKLWKEYTSTGLPGNTLTFDGGAGHNTLATNANNLEDFDPESAWNDAGLDNTFSVYNLQSLVVDGGSGGFPGTPGDRVDNIAADDPDRDVADVVAEYAVLDTGLFGDQLEDVTIDDASNMHVETRDSLTEATLRDTANVDLAAGSALEEVSLSGAQGSTVFADGDALEEITLGNSANGNTIEQVGEEQVIRFATTGSSDTTINATDEAESLQLSVGLGPLANDINLNGENVDTVNASYSSLGGRLVDVDVSGLTDDLTVSLEGASTSGVALFDAIMGDDQNSLTVEGTEDGREELYLGTGELGGLVNGDGVTIGADAVVYLSGFAGDTENLNIGGDGALGLRDIGSVNLFHADPGTFEVGRYDDNATLESIRSEAPVQVAGSMDTLQLGYAQQFSGDAARVELAGDGGAIEVENMQFTDGHVRDLELVLSDIAEPERADAVAPAHLVRVDTEALGPDVNRGQTESIDIQGSSNLYLGLDVREALDENGDPDGTHDRLAGLQDDGTISAGDGELNAVIINETDAGDYGEHELDLGQFTDTPDTLGFAGGIEDAETRLTDWDGSVRLYDGFDGNLTIEPEDGDLRLEVFGDATGNDSTIRLDSALADGDTLTVAGPEAGDVSALLRDQGRWLHELDVAGTNDLVLDAEAASIGDEYLWIDTVENLGADGSVVFREAVAADSAAGIDTLVQEADGDDSSALTVTTEGSPDDEWHWIGDIDMTAATADATVTFNGDGPNFGTDEINVGNAADAVTVTVNGTENWVGEILANDADAFEGSFADGTAMATIQAGTAETFDATFGDDVTVTGNINAAEATTVDVTFGDEANVDSITAGTAAADPDGEVNLTFGAYADVDTIEAGGDEYAVTASFGDGANVTSFEANAAEEVYLDLTSDSTIEGFDASGADSVEINFDGSGNRVSDVAVDGADMTINSVGGGSSSNTVEYLASPRAMESLTLAGDTALRVDANTPHFRDDATFDLTEMNANVITGINFSVSGDDVSGLTVELYGEDVSGADRSFNLFSTGAAEDLTFDFAEMASGQRVEIADGSAGIDEMEFLLEDVAFDLDEDNLLVNGFGIDDEGMDDWDDVFAAAADNEGDFTQIHNIEGDFELELVGVSADELTADNFDLIA